jgi:predicted DNA-binding transcriptional regulator AlpA
MKLIDREGLKALGIDYSAVLLWRRAKQGSFPKPVKLSASRNGWIEAEILAWLEGRAAERETAA